MTGNQLPDRQGDASDREWTNLRGSASDDGQVYQARGDQRITHVSFNFNERASVQHQSLMQAANAQQARTATNEIIGFLGGMIADLQVECTALREEARQAKAAGRAEALGEIQDDLRDYELRLLQAQSRLKEAQREREVAELLLIEAQRTAEKYRKDAEDLQRDRQRGAATARDSHKRAEHRDLRDYDRAMEGVDDGLAELREELRRLGNQVSQRLRDPSEMQVVQGEVVGSAGGSGEKLHMPDGAKIAPDEIVLPDSGEPSSSVSVGPSIQQSTGREDQRPLAKTRSTAGSGVVGFLGTCAVFLTPPLPLMIAGTSIKLLYTATSGPAVVWGLIFTVLSVLVASVLGIFFMFLGRELAGWSLDDKMAVGCGFYLVVSIGLFIYSLVRTTANGGALVAVAHFVVTALGPL